MYIRAFIAALLASCALAASAAVDVNRATRAELEALPGVGTSLSARILAERDKGTFKDWSDLMKRVRGIGKASAGRLSGAGLTVEGAPYPAAEKR